jgi:phenylacetate-CoA ligase
MSPRSDQKVWLQERPLLKVLSTAIRRNFIMKFTDVIYPLLQTLHRITLRRNYWREIQSQKCMRRMDIRTLEDYSHRQAVAYANRMASVIPAYRHYLERAGVTLPIHNSPASWQQLPTLGKADFQKDPPSWANPQMDTQLMRWSSTSGSTGEPYQFVQDDATVIAETVSNELFLKALGWRPSFKEAIFKMKLPPIKGPRRLIRKLMGNLPIGFSAVKFRREHAPEVVAKLRRDRVQYLRGYSSALALLAETAKKRSIRCPIPLITTFGEGLNDYQRKVIEEVFEGKVYRDYGGSEAMHIGFECPARTGYHMDFSRFFVEVLDGDVPVQPGGTGEIVVTCFRNSAMPFVRYRMGDLGTLADPDQPCPCGNTYPRLAAIQGRINDTVFTPGGQTVDSIFFVHTFEFFHKHITWFRVVQKETDLLEIFWVPRHGKAHGFLPDLERKLTERICGQMRILWRSVNEIPRDPSGKRRILVPLNSTLKPH